MLLTQFACKFPTFKERVCCYFQANELQIHYQSQACSLTIEQACHEDMVKLLRLLQVGGLSPDKLAKFCPSIEDEVEALLAEFERRGFLEETPSNNIAKPMSGKQFYREFYRFLERCRRRFPPSPFSEKMASGTITKEQLIGYALESYHVTHLCPRLLAPALAKYESIKTQKLLQEFFTSELHHDKLIEKSLKSVGFADEQIQQMQPLPMTFAVCTSLAVFAQQHPLNFKVALLLFEQDDRVFHQLFKQQSGALGLTADFYKPILLHADINEEGEHEDITRILLEEIPYVSVAEQTLVKKNIAVLMESMVKRTHEILDYYGNPTNMIPRCFT